ncbi:MAG: ABC transporter substrate-binding protein [Gemmatimonadota bacterium]|nr:ABC transporter substrate-binding protein [Gemmatimonadota bacterium]
MRFLLALSCLFVVACSAGGTDGTLVLGSAGPWTEGYGQMCRRGIELARDEINAVGGIRGAKLEIIFLDDSADGAVAARVARQFVDNPEVVGVIGHMSSGAMLAAAHVYNAGQLAAVATTVTTPALSGISPWILRVIASDSVNGVQLANAATRLGYQRAAVLYENDGYGRGLSASFRRAFKGRVISNDPIAGDISNAEPYVAWFKRERPDVVLVAGNDASALVVLREARRQQLTTQFIGGDGWTPIVQDTAVSEGALVGAPFTPADPRPEARAFVQAFRAKFNMDPDANAALGYDAARTLARALEAEGPNRAGIRDWLHALTAETAVRGATGPIRFLPSGDRVGNGMVITRARQGALVVEGAR